MKELKISSTSTPPHTKQALSNAIAPSGEGREYFAEGRVAWLKRCLDEIKQPVNSLLDFGCGDGATTPLLLQRY